MTGSRISTCRSSRNSQSGIGYGSSFAARRSTPPTRRSTRARPPTSPARCSAQSRSASRTSRATCSSRCAFDSSRAKLPIPVTEGENMYTPITRRRFFGCSGAIAGGAALAGALAKRSVAATSKKPGDFMIVEGHRDIWELSDRFKLRDKSQWSPMQDFTVPRLIEGGLSVVIMPATGGSVEERNGREQLLDGGMRVIDMLLMEIEKCGDKASILRTKADLPAKPNKGRVQFFLDIEGGATIQGDPEPNYHPVRSLALLRDFYRLGVRGMQLTHNGRNMLGQGVAEGKEGNRLSAFGVEVVKEMNRLGMMIGGSPLSAKGLLHVAEITKQPLVSSHQNIKD